MNEETPNAPADTENLAMAKALWGGKWFWPVLEDLERFENLTGHLSSVTDDALADDAPDWMFRAVWQCGLGMAEYTGQAVPQNLEAREVGKMIGTHWSICDACARSFPFWSTLKPEQIWKIDAAWWPGFSHACKEISREFTEKWTPLFREIRRKAMDIALNDGLSDELDYIQGYTQGTRFMAKVWENMKPPKHKRGKDAQARNCVYLFAMSCGRHIEDEKGKSSWPELHQEFLEPFEDKEFIDEETFKKIFSRLGLKGIGKVGRKVPVKKIKRNIPAIS